MQSHIQQDLFDAWIDTIGFSWIRDDDRYSNAPNIPDNDARIALNLQIFEVYRQKNAQEWREIYRQNPDCAGEVMQTTQEALAHEQFLANGHVVALDDPRLGRMKQLGAFAKMLPDIRLNVCASPAYLDAQGMPQTIHDLAAHDCLGYTLSTRDGTSQWSFGRDGSIKVPVRGSLHANNGDALVKAAIAGQGLVYGPRFIAAEAVADGRLVEITLDTPVRDAGAIYAVTPATRRPAAKTRAWINFLVSRFGSVAPNW